MRQQSPPWQGVMTWLCECVKAFAPELSRAAFDGSIVLVELLVEVLARRPPHPLLGGKNLPTTPARWADYLPSCFGHGRELDQKCRGQAKSRRGLRATPARWGCWYIKAYSLLVLSFQGLFGFSVIVDLARISLAAG
jgi:hypothetical protein